MQPRPTLKQLAKSLDLAVPTVSRALGGHSDIAVKTRERVAKRAREMGYVSNSAARMLVSGRSGFVSFIVPVQGADFIDPFLGHFVSGLGKGLAANGLDLFLSVVPEGGSELETIRRLVDSGRADGLVLARIAENDARVSYLIDRNVPFVAHGRTLGETRAYNWLDTCGEDAFAQAFETLYALGHRRIGLISISDPMSFRHYREQGFAQAIKDKNDPEVQLKTIRTPRADTAATRAELAAMLARDDRPTALIGLFDELALMAMQEAARAGLDVPGDLSIIGFDNVAASGFSSPGLSTFDQNIAEAAETLAQFIHKAIEDRPSDPMTSLVPVEFLARGSHGPAPGSVLRPIK